MPQLAASIPLAPTPRRFSIVAAAFVIGSFALFSGCQTKQDLIIRNSERLELRLVADSPAVRRLISDEEASEKAVLDSWQKGSRPENTEQQMKDVTEHPEHYTQGRSQFLLAMQQQPSAVVRGPAHIEILSTSLAACTVTPFATTNFVNVQVSEGPDQGKEGWVCSESIGVHDAVTNTVAVPAKAEPPIKTTLCELVTHPDKYVGRVVEISAVVERRFEVSLLVDNACSARVWLDIATANLDEEQYRRFDAYLRNNNQVGTVVGRFDNLGWFKQIHGDGFGHLGQWQSQLVMMSFKGA
ncbi:MAG: hypothetical protein ABSE57_28245 [Bryobacteraceae bacterium]